MPFIPAWLDDENLTPHEFRIACHIGRRGDCFESARSIASHCKISRNCTLKSIKFLVGKGIVSEAETSRGGTVLKLSYPSPSGSLESQSGSNESQEGGSLRSQGGSLESQGGSLRSQSGSNGAPEGTTPNKVIPLREKKAREVVLEKKRGQKSRPSPWPQILEMEWPGGLKNDPEFVELFREWVSFRSKFKKITQEPTVFFGRQLKKLSGWGVAGAVASVSKSLECEWQGIFEPDQRTMANGRGKPAKPNDELTAADFLA